MSHATVLVALDGKTRLGKGVEAAVAKQMGPFDENGTWFRDGSRWDWYQIGGRWGGFFRAKGKAEPVDVVRKRDLDVEAMAADRAARAKEEWERAQKADCNDAMREEMFGVAAGTTLEQHVDAARKAPAFTTYAFLRDGTWNESSRMGWWGQSASTECELKGESPRRCVTKDEKSGARVVTWNEGEEAWAAAYQKRFIDRLPDDAILVVVDYHV